MDLFPTLLELAGMAALPEQHVDGVSLASLLHGGVPRDHPSLTWHFPHYHGSGNVPSGAIRSGDWKLIEWFETGGIELYDLATDSAEALNIAPVQLVMADSLRGMLARWREDVDAAMPTPNPEWMEH